MLAEHAEPANRIKDYFEDPANGEAVARAVRAAADSPGALVAPGEMSMLPDFVRTHFIRVFDAGEGKARGIHTLEFIERASVYFPVSSRKGARGPRCQDLADAMVKRLEGAE